MICPISSSLQNGGTFLLHYLGGPTVDFLELCKIVSGCTTQLFYKQQPACLQHYGLKDENVLLQFVKAEMVKIVCT